MSSSFVVQVQMAQPLHHVRFSTAANESDYIELAAPFTAANWPQLNLVATAIATLCSAAFELPFEVVERQPVLRGRLPDLSPSIDIAVGQAEQARADLARSLIARFIESVTASPASGVLFSPAAVDYTKHCLVVLGEQRERLLSQVGGKIIATPMLIRCSELSDLALQGRWATLPADNDEQETVEYIDGLFDGFQYTQRRLFILDAERPRGHIVQFDEAAFLDVVASLCEQFGHGVRTPCRFEVLRRETRACALLLLRGIVPQALEDPPLFT